MAATAFQLYNAAKVSMMKGLCDLDTNTVRGYLYKSTANVSNAARTLRSSLSQECNAAGYTGAKTVTGVVRASGNAGVFDVSDMVWTASTANLTSVMYLVICVSNATAGNQVLCWSKLSASAFQVTQDNTLTVQIATAGVFALT
jgi:hypothetical protein